MINDSKSKKIQFVNQVIDISDWRKDEEFFIYQEGARDKNLIYSPTNPPFDFCLPNHRYLFKKSSHRSPEQYWIEIFAYRLGLEMGVTVPPTFVAYNKNTNICGALSEWFFATDKYPSNQYYVPGGDYFQFTIPDYNRKKGTQHNFELIASLCTFFDRHFNFTKNWHEYWVKTLTFDALIGNTDRHQDNWGIIFSETPSSNMPKADLTPIFDHGTSMGYEIIEKNFTKYDDPLTMQRYIEKGKHHMKWQKNDENRLSHGIFLQKLIQKYPEMGNIIENCLQLDTEIFKHILNELVKFEVPVKLSESRANFMLKLICARQQYLLNHLRKLI